MMIRTAILFYNPASGDTPLSMWIDRLTELYQNRGYFLALRRITFDAGDRTLLREVSAAAPDHLLIAGGDGTVNYMVGLLAEERIDLPVAVLPAGTANDFATMLGLPQDILAAAEAILDGSIRCVDLGRAGDRIFANVFSFGLFTDVSQKTPTAWKNSMGRLAYYIGGIGELPGFRSLDISVRSDGGDFDGKAVIMFVFNGRTAGTLPIAYLSREDDGLLDALIVTGDSPTAPLRTALRYLPLLRKQQRYPEGIVHIRCRKMHIQLHGAAVPTDVDGQPGPHFPVEIECLSGALRIMAPPKDAAHGTGTAQNKIFRI